MRYIVWMLVFLFGLNVKPYCQNGYDLWLGYTTHEKSVIKSQYAFIQSISALPFSNDPVYNNTLKILESKLTILLGKPIHVVEYVKKNQLVLQLHPTAKLDNEEGFIITSDLQSIKIEAQTSRGLLYGALHLLGLIHRKENIRNIHITETPKVKLRLLNHWDNTDRTVERGYAGFSIFNWHELPDYLDKRYEDYALANASIGINGTVVTNVNANAIVLRSDYLDKAAALANVFRKFGIKIFLTARFNAPMELGGIKTADPLNPEVIAWWNNKMEEIYQKIPDFGGFLVKANSEGQPGPQDYGRTHADGANMLAKPLKKYNGIVMWRAFVYNHQVNEDRYKQAYNEFVPLDGMFADNVLIQVKNGPIDFQPREPVHPIFGAMPKTPLMLELQITKEYMGQGTHLVGLGPMFKEVLQTDTHANDVTNTVVQIVDGSTHGYELTGMAGVSNIGTSFNWTGHLFGQADWYAFGRLAWNPNLDIKTIYDEWVKATFPGANRAVHKVALGLLLSSYETCVNYMTPLGLHHIMAEGHHYGPGPWVDSLKRADWNAVYYHRASKDSIGFDRTTRGSDAISLYHPFVRALYDNKSTCPDKYILWFHRLPWTHTLKSGKSIWDEMVLRYDTGVSQVREMNRQWGGVKGMIGDEIYESVKNHLNIQEREAQWWRDACLSYFHSISGMKFPDGVDPPPHPLKYYKSLSFPYSPGWW